MITWLRKLLWDETAFERFGRAIIFAIGQAMQHGLIPAGEPGWYIGIIVQVLALTIGAGEKNPKQVVTNVSVG